ncbi:MAG: hypothetical protein ACJAV1_002690 [Paraglaciecola sp.]|jgi:hypothetical protein
MKGILFLFVAVFSANSYAESAGVYNEWLSASSKMNWSSGLVTAEGFGVAPQDKRKEVGQLLACRAAVTDAQRGLVEATYGVRVSVTTSVSNYAADYDTVKIAVDGVVRGAHIIDREMGEGDTCKVTMGLFVSGKLSNSIYENSVPSPKAALLILQKFWLDMLPVAHAQNILTPLAFKGNSDPLIDLLDKRVSILESSILENALVKNAQSEPQPTGLIIDVRGFRFLPSLAPEIKHPRGVVIYPSAKNKESIIKSGKLLSLYSRSVEFAMNHPFVGNRPLLIKGESDPDQVTNILLDQQSGDRLLALASNKFFDEPSVIIVLD